MIWRLLNNRSISTVVALPRYALVHDYPIPYVLPLLPDARKCWRERLCLGNGTISFSSHFHLSLSASSLDISHASFTVYTMSRFPMLGDPLDMFPRTYIVACGETQQFQRLCGYNCDSEHFFRKRAAARDDIWFWNTFAKAVRGQKREQRHCAVVNPRPLTPLERLPNELFELVLDALLKDQLAALALGLASPILYSKILSRIHRDYAHSRTATWAGKEVGFYGGRAPVPPAPILKFQKHCLTDDIANPKSWYTGWISISMQPEYSWRKSLGDARGRWEEMDEVVWRHIDRDLSQDYMYPQDRVWVLRNLTTRQFVRSDDLVPPAAILGYDALSGKSRKKHFPSSSPKKPSTSKGARALSRDKNLHPLPLPQVFLILTAHSTHHQDWREEPFDFRSGPWASHVFEVVTLDEHLESEGSEWEDVSTKVAADVGHLRWCVRQHAQLATSNVDGLWDKMKRFRQRVPKARAKWTRWARIGDE